MKFDENLVCVNLVFQVRGKWLFFHLLSANIYTKPEMVLELFEWLMYCYFITLTGLKLMNTLLPLYWKTCSH